MHKYRKIKIFMVIISVIILTFLSKRGVAEFYTLGWSRPQLGAKKVGFFSLVIAIKE